MCAMLTLAHSYSEDGSTFLKADVIAHEHGLPFKFLEGILGALRTAGLVMTRRGAEGGYRLARAPQNITVADIVRALDGPLAAVRGERPEEVDYSGAAVNLRDVWIATRAALRSVFEHVTLAQILDGKLPSDIVKYLDEPGAWERRI